jgi:hypothetical protein
LGLGTDSLSDPLNHLENVAISGVKENLGVGKREYIKQCFETMEYMNGMKRF